MSNKRITNSDIYAKLEVLTERINHMKKDIEEVKELAPRVRSLESFRSYIHGSVAVVVAFGGAVFASIKGFF